MTNPIFILKSQLLVGSYLLGDYLWTEAMRLGSASLIAFPPTVGSVTVTLEVAGVLTEKTMTFTASALSEVRQSLVLGVRLSAGQSVRWKVTAVDGAVEESANHIAITLTAYREADAVVTDQAMTVWWQSGTERFKLFTYDPLTHAYTTVNAALSSSRASFTSGADFRIAIAASDVLVVATQILYTEGMVAGGLQVAAQPQLQFYVGSYRIATLTAGGVLHVPTAVQASPVDQINQFLLGDGAALNATGVISAEFAQGI